MRHNTKKPIGKLLKFTCTGHTLYISDKANGYSNCSSNGYESPESFVKPYHWWAHPPDQISTHFDGYTFPEEGIPVVDIRTAVDTDQGLSWVFKGPLLDVDLEEGEIDRLPDVSPLMAPAICAYGQGLAVLETMAARKTPKAGPLDGVGVTEYVQGWKEHGAKVGRFYVRDGQGVIEWE